MALSKCNSISSGSSGVKKIKALKNYPKVHSLVSGQQIKTQVYLSPKYKSLSVTSILSYFLFGINSDTGAALIEIAFLL